jgi:hypothetical protein
MVVPPAVVTGTGRVECATPRERSPPNTQKSLIAEHVSLIIIVIDIEE